MKTNIFILLFVLVTGVFVGCEDQTTPEALNIQKPYTYSDLYYQNLRDYKKSDHSIAFGWFADYTQHHSLAIRFMGLPDSLDICSLWGGIPSLKKNDPVTFYDSIAYKEMRFVRDVKGTKMVVPTIIRIANFPQFSKDSVGVNAFGDYLVNMVLDNDLDGADLDYEPEGDYLTGEPMSWLIKHMGEKLGPKSSNPDKLLIIDFYGTIPPSDTDPYVNYFVCQAYNASSDNSLNVPNGIPNRKYVVTENIGDNWQNGGVAYTQYSGNTLSIDGSRLYSLEGMARWIPRTGDRKGGFGAFYMHRDYNLDPPYKTMRKAIQTQNPAVH
ncbi:glycoside hydrolase family 18 [uncultured Bacteroides sp.]|uniref:glycoside hydrolase family 18 n=1 Tax=uncultured Bacteroides sp. TaxID=162156 RepID=UPI002AAA9058|nr:glycoside hydrolase family 18 [uncultured Bacteroides sp.]